MMKQSTQRFFLSWFDTLPFIFQNYDIIIFLLANINLKSFHLVRKDKSEFFCRFLFALRLNTCDIRLTISSSFREGPLRRQVS